MRSTARSLVLTSILGALIASPLAAQSYVRFGATAPTTVLTTAQRIFAEAYVDAVTGMDIERYKYLLHPATLACMNGDNADYFKLIFDHRIGRDADIRAERREAAREVAGDRCDECARLELPPSTRPRVSINLFQPRPRVHNSCVRDHRWRRVVRDSSMPYRHAR